MNHNQAPGNARASSAPIDNVPFLKRDVLIICAALVLAVVLRLAFFRGVYAIDDFNYLRHAAEVWKGRFELGDVLYWHGVRPIVFVPVSWMFALFGVSEITAVAWPFAASLATVMLVYRIGCRLYGFEAGVYSALLAAMFPLLVEEATQIHPGAIMNLIFASSAFCFLKAEKIGGPEIPWLILSGLLFAAVPWIGQLGLVFAIFFPLALLFLRRHSLTSYWPLVAGASVVILAGALYQWIAAGNPFINVTVGREVLTSEVPALRPFYYLKLMFLPLYRQGGGFYLAMAGILAALISRRREALFVAAWLFAGWLLIEFGSSGLSEYRPLFKLERYLSVLAIPAVLLSGFGLAWIRNATASPKSLARRTAKGNVVAAAFLALALALSIFGLKKGGQWEAEQRARLAAVGKEVRSRKGSIIYVTHWLWNTRAGFFMKFDDDYFPSGYDPYHAVRLEKADAQSRNRYVQLLAPGEEMAPGLLLHDEKLFELSQSGGGGRIAGVGEIPDVLAHPPESWRLIDRIYLGAYSVLALYEIPGGRWPVSSGNRQPVSPVDKKPVPDALESEPERKPDGSR